MKIAGVEGESHDSKHSKEIDVLSWNWGMAQAGNAHMGGGAGAGKVSVNDISIVKNVDSSTNLLYQTASIYRSTNHVGKLKSRCMAEKTCSDAEEKLNAKYSPKKENEREQKKSFPDRFPSKLDSIGIELVGKDVALDAKKPNVTTYEKVTDSQNASLKWLIEQLEMALCIFGNVVFRHPDVSRKNSTEASTAKWN